MNFNGLSFCVNFYQHLACGSGVVHLKELLMIDESVRRIRSVRLQYCEYENKIIQINKTMLPENLYDTNCIKSVGVSIDSLNNFCFDISTFIFYRLVLQYPTKFTLFDI